MDDSIRGEEQVKESPKCQTCGAQLIRSHTVEDYLIWECPNCTATEIESFCDMSDESWEWVKTEARKGKNK